MHISCCCPLISHFKKCYAQKNVVLMRNISDVEKTKTCAHCIQHHQAIFLYCLQQKRILRHYLLMALNIWCMLPLNKNEIKFKHIIKLYYMSYLCVIFNASKQLLYFLMICRLLRNNRKKLSNFIFTENRKLENQMPLRIKG